jgi:hypothetical protein
MTHHGFKVGQMAQRADTLFGYHAAPKLLARAVS